MRIGRKLFPYPVLNNNPTLSSFENTSFSLNTTLVQEKEFFVLKQASISTNNETILEMMEDGYLGATVIVECSSTVFRSNFEISNVPMDIKIPIRLLREKVFISSFIYAKKAIKNFQSEDFQEEYKPYKFDLNKYSIVAADDGFNTYIDYEEEENRKASSIFLIIKNEDSQPGIMKVNLTSKKIILNLSSRYFEIYHGLKNNQVFKDVFFSLLAVPSLVYALQKVKSNEEIDIERIRSEYIWFHSIENAYENIYKTELNNENFKKLSSIEFAQEVLDQPTTRALDDLLALNTVSMSIEEE
jgi:hypothetical protein